MNKPTPLKVSAPVRRRPNSPKTSLDKTQSRGEKRRTAGVGLSPTIGDFFRTALSSELFGVLDRGVASLDDTRNGRPWPRPRKHAIAQLIDRYGEETCRLAAQEAREIVQSQNFAPNVTALFAKKCADIETLREERRELLRRAVG